MQIATRIDFARPQAATRNTGAVALALASGIASLTLTYPAATFGNATFDKWTGKFEAKASPLTAHAIPPEMSITAKIQGAALAVRGAFKAGAAGLSDMSDALAPEISSIAAVTATGLGELAVPETRAMPVAEVAQGPARLAGPSSANEHGFAAGGRLSRHDAAQSAAPLDAVRIALPRREPIAGKAGALAPDVALERMAVPDVAPVPAAESQPLVASARPEAPSALAPDRLSDTPPFGALSASKEVREFDLAKLGATKPEAMGLARTSAAALALGATKATPRAQPKNLSKVAKVPDRIVGDHILHVAGLTLDGVPSGNLAVRIGMSGDLSVKLADILTPLRDQMAPESFGTLIDSSAASEYVSFADLRAAGFDVRYDAGNDRLMISAQP